MWLAFEHEVLRDESWEGVMERDLGQVLAVPEDRLMQVTTSGFSGKGMGGRMGFGVGWYRPVLALEGLLGDSSPSRADSKSRGQAWTLE